MKIKVKVGLLKDFQDFAMKGNVVDMAVGVVIGGAFGKIVSSLLNDIIMPPLGWITGGVDFSDLVFTIKPAEGAAKAVTVNYGAFITACIDFVIVAAAMFAVVRAISVLKRSEPVPVAAPTEKNCPECLMTIPIQAKRCGHCAQAVA
jgi:large conductance mechanosensitive channel